MKKIILIAATLVALLISNVAAAKYSDEYKAQHKRRVEVVTTQLPSGQKYTREIFKLFDRQIPGGKIRLKQKGIVSMKEPSQKGDEYVIIQIEVPKNLSEQERAAIERLREVQRGHGRQNRRAS